MPSTTRYRERKQQKQTFAIHHPPDQSYRQPTDDTTETIIRIATWNQNTRYSPTSAAIQELAVQNEIDILTIQEPNQKITQQHTHEHAEFNQQIM